MTIEEGTIGAVVRVVVWCVTMGCPDGIEDGERCHHRRIVGVMVGVDVQDVLCSVGLHSLPQ